MHEEVALQRSAILRCAQERSGERIDMTNGQVIDAVDELLPQPNTREILWHACRYAGGGAGV